jgi:hypothetical protein
MTRPPERKDQCSDDQCSAEHGVDDGSDTFQARFESRWHGLTQPDVRALAWLLDAPDLLDPACTLWRGQIASLGPVTPATAVWLMAQQRDPAPLLAALGSRPSSRLGLYAEKLLAFYFEQHGLLLAHSVQVRDGKNATVGEFDFLLRGGPSLLHWEFATKFYLSAPAPDGLGNNLLDRLIGPNLADTLGLKMRKILDLQLALAQHPAAQRLLPQPVAQARALVKGWLFHPDGEIAAMEGIAAAHCHGFWCTLAQAGRIDGDLFVLLPRLQWLAPWKAAAGSALPLSRAQLLAVLAARFDGAASPASMPVMVAQVRRQGHWLLEQRRGFIVPDDWEAEAALRRRDGRLPS